MAKKKTTNNADYKTVSVLIKHYNVQLAGATTNTNDVAFNLNHACTNKLMSSKALGLYLRLSRLSHKFYFTKEAFTATLLEGKDSTNSGLNELIATGLLYVKERRDENGKFNGNEFHLFERPIKQEERHEIEAGRYSHVEANGLPYYSMDFPRIDEAVNEEPVIETLPPAENPPLLFSLNSLEGIILNSAYARNNNINDIKDLEHLEAIIKDLLKTKDVMDYKGLTIPTITGNELSKYDQAVAKLDNEDAYSVVETYLDNIGSITKGALIRLVALLQYADADLINVATEQARDLAKVAPIKYIEETVKDWLTKGIYTGIDAETHLYLYRNVSKYYADERLKPTGEVVGEYYNWMDEL